MPKISTSINQTQHIAAQFSRLLKGGDIIGFQGELGSGKTTFIQGLLHAFGISGPITSPTFVLMQLYPIEKHPSIKRICHIDAYRLSGASDIESTGIKDYLGAPDSLCLIEWPENLQSQLQKKNEADPAARPRGIWAATLPRFAAGPQDIDRASSLRQAAGYSPRANKIIKFSHVNENTREINIPDSLLNA